MLFNHFTIIIGAILGLILFFRLPGLKKPKHDKDIPLANITVIIPVRNEAENLPNILSDLRAQTQSIHEIICVDDDSEDETAQIIASNGAKCIQLSGPPEGWKGKTWACQNGAKAAKGDLLVFLDADVRLSTTAMETLLREYQKTGKPISVLPYHTVTKPHEYFSLFFNFIKICATAMSIGGIKRTFGLYGPVFCIKKDVFDQFCGFTPVKDHVAEDLNLGIFYCKHDTEIHLLMGNDQIRFRMYPRSFKDLLEGWSKNFSRGAVSLRWWILVMIFIWVASLNAVPLEIMMSLNTLNYAQLTLMCGTYLLFVAMLNRIARRAGSYPLYVTLLYPVYLIVFELIFLYSIVASFFLKTTTWKGRKL